STRRPHLGEHSLKKQWKTLRSIDGARNDGPRNTPGFARSGSALTARAIWPPPTPKSSLRRQLLGCRADEARPSLVTDIVSTHELPAGVFLVPFARGVRASGVAEKLIEQANHDRVGDVAVVWDQLGPDGHDPERVGRRGNALMAQGNT